MKTTPLNFERVHGTVLHHYAERLKAYGYRPTVLRQMMRKNSRGQPEMTSLYEFRAGAFRVVFLVSRNAYRLKIEDGEKVVFLSPFYVSANRWERPFLYFFNDETPIYPVRETWTEAKARRRAEDKAAGLKASKDDD